jgi:hypothetical protein
MQTTRASSKGRKLSRERYCITEGGAILCRESIATLLPLVSVKALLFYFHSSIGYKGSISFPTAFVFHLLKQMPQFPLSAREHKAFVHSAHATRIFWKHGWYFVSRGRGESVVGRALLAVSSRILHQRRR